MALSGCVRVLVDTTVHEDDTFSGRVVLAVTEAVEEQLTGNAPGDFEGLVPAGDPFADAASSEEFVELQERFPGQIEVRDYVEGDRQGIELTVDRLPLEEFNATAGHMAAFAGPSTTLTREGNTYVVTLEATGADERAEIDGEEVPGGPLVPGGPGLPGGDIGLLESAIDFDIIYRFPGLVTEASAGTINGNTVTLGLSDVVDGGEIRIVAGADPEINWGPIVQWGLIALAFVVIIGGATALVIQDKRKRRPTHLPPPRTTPQD